MGPVKLQFAGTAHIMERDDDRQADGRRRGGRGREGPRPGRHARHRAALGRPKGTKVEVDQDLQLSGAAAQYGRGMISDVTAVLMRDFATNMQGRIAAIERGSQPGPDRSAAPASGLAIGLRAMRMALTRVFRGSSCPTNPNPS